MPEGQSPVGLGGLVSSELLELAPSFAGISGSLKDSRWQPVFRGLLPYSILKLIERGVIIVGIMVTPNDLRGLTLTVAEGAEDFPRAIVPPARMIAGPIPGQLRAIAGGSFSPILLVQVLHIDVHDRAVGLFHPSMSCA